MFAKSSTDGKLAKNAGLGSMVPQKNSTKSTRFDNKGGPSAIYGVAGRTPTAQRMKHITARLSVASGNSLLAASDRLT